MQRFCLVAHIYVMVFLWADGQEVPFNLLSLIVFPPLSNHSESENSQSQLSFYNQSSPCCNYQSYYTINAIQIPHIQEMKESAHESFLDIDWREDKSQRFYDQDFPPPYYRLSQMWITKLKQNRQESLFFLTGVFISRYEYICFDDTGFDTLGGRIKVRLWRRERSLNAQTSSGITLVQCEEAKDKNKILRPLKD